VETALYIIIFVLIFAVGAVFASFLNVVIYRLPRRQGFVVGSSYCPKCEHKLRSLDLVPILSYLFLRGKCRYCHESISPRYLIIEFIGGVAAVFSYAAFLPPLALLAPQVPELLYEGGSAVATGLVAIWLPLDIPVAVAAASSTVLLFALFCVLILVAFIDGDTMEIPDSLNIWLAAIGFIGLVIGPFASVDWMSHLIGIFCVSLPMLILTLIIKGAFGLGDVKLIAAAGLLLGWQLTLVAAFIGILIGGFYGIYLLISKRKGRKDHFAFGPALCVGIAASCIWGNAIIGWYAGFF
jgi:leader peptidase (prepilin peptidase)/N-methyltransferase